MKNERDNFLKIFKSRGLPKKIHETVASLDRTEFFDELFAGKAYTGEPIVIGHEEKSDDAKTLARMIEILNPQKGWRLLEVGTGTGYSSALLASCVSELVTVDYHENLALRAKERVLVNGFRNVKFLAGDVTDITADLGEFDAAIIFAGCRKRPMHLFNMFEKGGAIVFPMGPPHQQQIVRFDLPKKFDYSESLRYGKFYDFCLYDSIRGVYGWVDQTL